MSSYNTVRVGTQSDRTCPDCEQPNQFGELCRACLRERMTDNPEAFGDMDLGYFTCERAKPSEVA